MLVDDHVENIILVLHLVKWQHPIKLHFVVLILLLICPYCRFASWSDSSDKSASLLLGFCSPFILLHLPLMYNPPKSFHYCTDGCSILHPTIPYSYSSTKSTTVLHPSLTFPKTVDLCYRTTCFHFKL